MPDKGVSRSSISRFIPLGLLVLAGVLFVALGGLRYRSFGALAENCEGLRDFVAQGGIAAGLAFVLAYAGLVALSLPVAAFLSITSGFLFGCWLGAVYAVIGATIGATIVFLAVRVSIAGLALGAGSGGLAVAAGPVQMGASVVLLERGEMGGDCLNYGCVPSKSLLAAAKLADMGRHGGALGVFYEPPRIDFAAVADSVERVVAAIAPNDSQERFERLGVRVIRAEARFLDRRTAQAGDTLIRPRRFVIATGSHPVVPSIPGLDTVPYFTNETIFTNRERPDHLIVIGGGPVGIELAQAYRRLGAAVTVIDAGPLLPHEDQELAGLLIAQFAEEGIALKPSVAVQRIERRGSGLAVVLNNGEQIIGSHLLIATGRRADTAALNLDAAGIETTPHAIKVDARLRTTNRRALPSAMR